MFITDYLIVVALDEETDYTYEVLERELNVNLAVQPADAAMVSALGRLHLASLSGSHEELMVVVSPGEMGHSAMAASLPAVIERWRPRDIILIGISGSLKPDSVKLGDVLVPMRVFGYAQAKILFSDGKDNWKFRTMGERATTAVRTELRTIGVLDRRLRMAWEQKCLEAAQDIDGIRDRVSEAPKVHIHENDALGTGNFVVASSAFAGLLQERVSSTIVGVDMEAGGVFEAMAKIEWNNRVAVIRGISDYADEDKSSLESGFSNGWRKYSMQNAVRLACALIKQRPMWKDKGQTRQGVSPPYNLTLDRHSETYQLCREAQINEDDVGGFNIAYMPFIKRVSHPDINITIRVEGPNSNEARLRVRERTSPYVETWHRPSSPGFIEIRKPSSNDELEMDLMCSAPKADLSMTVTVEDEFGRRAVERRDFPGREAKDAV